MISILFRYDFFSDFSLMMGIDENAAKLINVGMNWFISILFVIKWILPLVGQIMEVINVTINNFSFLPKREVDEKLGYKVVVKEYIEEARAWRKLSGDYVRNRQWNDIEVDIRII